MSESTVIATGERLTGKMLARKAGLSVEHALYRQTGDWYHIPQRFPAALFDEFGYIMFASRTDYGLFTSGPWVNEYPDSNTLSIPQGISTFSDYISLTPYGGDEFQDSTSVWEGAKLRTTVNVYERNRAARSACIRHWGLACSACKLTFGTIYGALGAGFIHVHHLVPLHSIGETYLLDPINHLRPVCANCHAMIHRREPPISIEELQDIINRRAPNEKTLNVSF